MNLLTQFVKTKQKTKQKKVKKTKTRIQSRTKLIMNACYYMMMVGGSCPQSVGGDKMRIFLHDLEEVNLRNYHLNRSSAE